MLKLDHLAILGETLEEAAAHGEAALGLAMGPGGKHRHYGTHNRLLGLAEGLYLEAIAVDPGAPPPGRPRWFGLDGFSGPARLDKWILRCDDIAAVRAALPEAGEPVELSRGALEWVMLVPPDGVLPFDGMFPAVIQWRGETAGPMLPDAGARLARLEVACPPAEKLAARLVPFLADARVSFREAESSGLTAWFDTGAGPRVLQ